MLYIATLVYGLPEQSRTMRAITGQQFETTDRLIALVIDLMQNYIWLRGGKKGTQPQSLFRGMASIRTDEFGFDSAEEFERARQEIIEGNKNGV